LPNFTDSCAIRLFEAVRSSAQTKLLGDRVYEHPAGWSPFLLLNNWL
jgi:hypothetical protein